MTFLKRWLPSPLLSAFLLAMWLALNQTVAPGHLLLGGLLAVYGPLATAALRPVRARVRNPMAIARLFVLVLVDIFNSNIAVTWVILGRRERRQNSGFMKIPLDVRDPHALAVLAGIITACPGTVWGGLSPDRSMLTIHVLDLQDESVWVDIIKNRYEKPLMEIFE